MLDSTPETNSKMPENQAEPNNQSELMDQGASNTPAEPNNQAEPIVQSEPNAQDELMDQGEEPSDQDEPINESEVAPNGFWANLSAEKKRWVTIGGLALAVIVAAIILFPKHRSPDESAKKAPAPTQTAAQAVSDAEQTVMLAPTAENYVNLSAV